MTRLTPLFLILLLTPSITGAPAVGGEKVETLTLVLPAGEYQIGDVENGYAGIEVDGFGALGVPGKPQLPAKTFLIALPPGAKVQSVNITSDGPVPIQGSYEIIPAKAAVHDAASEDDSRSDADQSAQMEWQTNYDLTYASDAFYPGQIGGFLGQGQWRKYTYARVAFHPVQYQPKSGRLLFHPSCTVSIAYSLPKPQSAEWRQFQELRSDHVLEDVISQWLINYEEAQAWYQPDISKPSGPNLYAMWDYVIIVKDAAMAAAVAPLVTWKQTIGHSVRVETLDTIYANYQGDDAEKIWNFLHEKYPGSGDGWGIRYVLLIGDIDVLPMRLLYPGDGDFNAGYATDYYYAKLSAPSWDVDGDGRWGEFTEDNFDPTPDVLVGRIPLNDPEVVARVCNNIVAFEQDTGSWKRNALLAHGIMDYTPDRRVGAKTDTADLSELLIRDIFEPHGWTSTTLYEKAGIAGSSHPSDQPLSQVNFENESGLKRQSIVNVMAHGHPSLMSSVVWVKDVNNNNLWDPAADASEKTYTEFSKWDTIQHHPVSAVVFLSGCETGNLLKADNNYSSSPALSKHLVRTPYQASMVKEYLANGAVAVIGATATASYQPLWSTVADGSWQSFNYYFFDHLINQRKRVGDSFYDAHLQYIDQHNGPVRGIRVFNYYGDPSLILTGVQERPGGNDALVHEGAYWGFAADNSDNGDMYVAVITTRSSEPGQITVYRSTSHGTSWSQWKTLTYTSGFFDVDVIVDNAGGFLLVFCSTTDGSVRLYRYGLGGSGTLEIPIRSLGDPYRVLHVSAARNVVAYSPIIFVAFSIYDSSTDQHAIHVCRTLDQGTTWQDCATFADYDWPSIDFAPSYVHLAARKTDGQHNIAVTRSLDNGLHWTEPWINLTDGDGAYDHEGPVVVASTNPSLPTVWVAYSYSFQISPFLLGGEIRYAYSQNAGADWTRNQVVEGFATTTGGGNAGARSVHMKSYKASANQWVNAAYNSNPGFKTQVMWRYSDGASPFSWSVPRIVNDHDLPTLDTPHVLYSPGAAGTGAGVVYGTETALGWENIYFSAPWLTSTPAAAREHRGQDDVMTLAFPSSSGDGTSAKRDMNEGPALPPGEIEQPVLQQGVPVWLATGELERAMAVSSLLVTDDGVLYASAATNVDEATNEGVVFRSFDGGESWERTGDLENCWSVASLLLSSDGNLIAGGLSLTEGTAEGVIYLSEDGGDTWQIVLSFPDGVVSDLVETDWGGLYAATGWNGLLFESDNGGYDWYEVAQLGADIHIHSILETSGGSLFVALEGPDGGGIQRSEDGGEHWTPAGGLDGVSAVYDLLEGTDLLYAGTRGEEMGWVYQSDLAGLVWTRTAQLLDGDVRAVHGLLEGPQGEILAGTERALGSSVADVFITRNEGTSWEPFCGSVDLANSVYALIEAAGVFYAATGHVYGNVYECTAETQQLERIYLPLVPRNAYTP